MSVQKTTECKFCGRLVTGESITSENKSFRFSRGVSRVTGTIAGVLSGRPVSAMSHATGKSEDGIQRGTEYVLGGASYRFKCGHCGQEFVKVIY